MWKLPVYNRRNYADALCIQIIYGWQAGFRVELLDAIYADVPFIHYISILHTLAYKKIYYT